MRIETLNKWLEDPVHLCEILAFEGSEGRQEIGKRPGRIENQIALC